MGTEIIYRKVTAQCRNLVALHMMHMTSENLHSKGDIAVELAARDLEIETLKVRVQLFEKAIALYCREELRNMNFERDSEAVEYMLSWGVKDE